MLRKIFWDRETGTVIYTSSWMGDFEETTFDQDYETYKFLNERVKETIKMTVYKEGEYEEDFANCTSVRMNLETETPEFSYPEPGEDPQDPPVFRKPLTEEVEELNTTLGTLLLESANDKATIASLEDTMGTLLFEVAALKGGVE